VLAGAAAKGAFTAGVLAVLSRPDVKARIGLDVARVVGASSGAINGVYYAAAVHAGEEANAGERLAQLWIEHGGAMEALDPSLRDILRGEALSTDHKLLRTFRENVAPAPTRRPVELSIIVTNVDGDLSSIDGEPATTYEHLVEVSNEDFTSADALDRVFTAVAASAALPGAYAPVALPVGAGRTVQALDGGLTDNTPIGHALSGVPAVTRAFVIAPFPRVQTRPADLRGVGLVSHVFDMLIEERLFRDLRAAARVNRVLAQLEAIVPETDRRAAILDALGLGESRHVQIVEIRPPETLPGDALSGLWSRKLREGYVQAGREAAEHAVEALVAR
jgi:hypothetical protein